jgi:hypothetical protein
MTQQPLVHEPINNDTAAGTADTTSRIGFG